MPVKTSEREYRRIDVAALELRSESDEQMVVEGYATTFGNEYVLYDDGEFRLLESIDANAFADADMSDVIMQYDHQGRVFARIRNKTLQLAVDDHGLRITAMLGGTQLGRQLYEEIKGGYTDRMSWGFTVDSDVRTEERDETNHMITIHRKITKIKRVFDVSAVSIPANDATEISTRVLSDGVIAEVRQELASAKERERKIQIIKILLEAAK